MFGNGVKMIGIAIIKVRPLMAMHGLIHREAITVFFAVVLGTMIRQAAEFLVALGSILLIGAALSVFVLRGTIDPLHFLSARMGSCGHVLVKVKFCAKGKFNL